MTFKKAKWTGDPAVLPVGAVVEILATDESHPDAASVPSSTPCWVRWWRDGSDYPRYRSCDLRDLDLV